MNWQEKTIQSYDESAEALSEYFQGIGSRITDIEFGLELANANDGRAKVIEIGCGDGRDATEIVKRVSQYEGFDPSAGMLKIAKAKLPNASFVQADALTYEYPKDVDVIFAFASILHVSKFAIGEVFEKAAESLSPQGIFYISLKERDNYEEEIKEDEYGRRMFYYYNPELISSIAEPLFETIHTDHQEIGRTKWFTIALSNI
jgi:SAM-dependent methyltransferase